MSLRCSVNTQSFFSNRWSSTLQFIKGKSRGRRKLLRYLSGILTSMLRMVLVVVLVDVHLLDSQLCGLFGVSTTIFVLYSIINTNITDFASVIHKLFIYHHNYIRILYNVHLFKHTYFSTLTPSFAATAKTSIVSFKRIIWSWYRSFKSF